MQNALRQLGKMVQVFRSSAGLTQSELAERTTPPVSRTAIALLEQGRRLPDAGALDRVCRLLGIPEPYWQPLLDDDNRRIAEFEDILGELVGSPVSLQDVDGDTAKAARGEILTLLDRDLTTEQTFDTFRSLLVYYGVHPPSKRFFDRYLDADSFRTAQAFQKAVANYQRDAIRLFSTFADGYRALALSAKLDAALEPLQPRDDESYRQRTEWTRIVNIDEERLADLGYIAAERVKRESAERAALRTFLVELAKEIRQNGPGALTATSDKKRRKMDSLLRQFDPGSRHSLFSPLFLPDPDQLERKAEQVGPKEDTDLARMGETQSIAQQNLAHYLAADHLDVYVATSMRSDADFVSVNRFVSALFQHDSIRPLKLRFFNPTQSWIDDRVAKGLVEALMLRRASMTIYMAQKDDTPRWTPKTGN